MIFSSVEFIFLFLPVTVFVYWYFVRIKASSLLFLSIASLLYYSYWKVDYILVIITSIIGNFYLGEFISQKRNKSALKLGIIVNICLLFYYKYTDFFIDNINTILGFSISSQNIVLPLAISFFTFQQIAFLVDCYKGVAKEYSFEKYLLFISFFPQLIAGPIVHHADLIPQFYNKKIKQINWSHFREGLLRFSIGLFKKVIIADSLSSGVSAIYDGAGENVSLATFDAWGGTFLYTLQIYFDFSGYSDMAIGIGKFFNINLPENFNSPYKAKNITDFWRRWHITLSTFLKDYLYIPLGGNRAGKFMRYRNLMVTMLLGGIWHGAGWNFLIWGGLHGAYLVVNHFTTFTMKNIETGRLWDFLSWGVTLVAVMVGWVFFRAKELADAKAILNKMFLDINLQTHYVFKEGDLWLISVLLIFVAILKNGQQLMEYIQDKKNSILFIMFEILVLAIPLYKIVFEANRVHEFLYFDF